jgi:hypothetical protein
VLIRILFVGSQTASAHLAQPRSAQPAYSR